MLEPIQLRKLWSGRRKNKRRTRGDGQIIIGLIGTTSGVGTTSTAISLSIFLSNYCHYRVAYVENNSNMHMDSVRKAAGISKVREYFRINRVDYFTISLEEALQVIREKGYDYIIVDYGVFDSSMLSKYIQCNYRLVMGSLSEWKRDCYLNIIQNNRFLRKDTIYLATLGRKYDINCFYKEYGTYLKSVPCIYDPFLLDNNITCFWRQFPL